MRHVLIAVAILDCCICTIVAADGTARWPQFRGPEASGIATDSKKLPVHFGADKNLLWKTTIPPGHSSPCIWDNRIFLTSFDKPSKKLETLCLDRGTGKILWRAAAPNTQIEKSHDAGSPAVATPATDGKHVYLYFGSYGLICYDFDGKEKWKKPLPMARTVQGNGTSPIIYGNVLLLNREFPPEPGLLAVDCQTGQTIWSIRRQLASLMGPNNGYSTPIVWHKDGVDEVIVHSPTRINAYDLKDGAERWVIHATSTACTTPVIGDGMLFVDGYYVGSEPGERDEAPSFDELLKKADKNGDGKISRAEFPDDLDVFRRPEATGVTGTALKFKMLINRIDSNFDGQITREEWEKFTERMKELAGKIDNGLIAIKPGGSGDITGSHIVWREKKALPEVPSPLFYQGRIFMVRDGGLATCIEAATGKVLFRERLGPSGTYFASPIAGDHKIYAASRDGVITVFEASDKLKVLARNRLGETINATPAAVDGKLYIRTDNHLYAFGE